VERRAQKQLELRLRRGSVNSTKSLESFDWSFNPGINRQQVLHLASGDYIREKRNLLVCGPSGPGKSHLAQALCHEACRQGFDVLFVNTHKMLQHLNGGRADGTLERRLQTYLHPSCWCWMTSDSSPCAPAGARGPLRRDQRAVREREHSADQQPVPGGMAGALWRSTLASAGIDCLAHRAEILIITGPSFRAQGRQRLLEQEVSQTEEDPA
jgi:hypothetical protein